MDKQDSNENTGNQSGVEFLGEYLKQKRIDKNYTLEKLSQKTKISINILKSLEANDYKNLPSAAYIKGFVRSYVKVLGVSQDEAINKMEYTYLNLVGKQFPALNHTINMANKTSSIPANMQNKSDAQSAQDVIESGDSIIENTKSVFPILVLGGIILAIIGGYKLISSIVEDEVSTSKSKDLGPKIESSAALVNKPAEKAPEASKVASEKDDTAAVAPEAAKTTEEKTEVVKPLPEFPRNFPTLSFNKIKGRLFTVDTESPDNSNGELISQQIKDAMNPSLQNIYIKAVDGNTWLSYKIDNSPIESVIINKSNDLFLQGNEIRIFLGNVNVTRIFYNNYLIKTPTKSGVKSLVFPEENSSKFQLPLFPKAKDDILHTSEDYIKRMKLEEEEAANRKIQE